MRPRRSASRGREGMRSRTVDTVLRRVLGARSTNRKVRPMAEIPQHHIRETATLRFARFVTRNRLPIAILLFLTTVFFMYPIVNAVLYATGHKLPGPIIRVNTSARALYPDHPFINA